MSADGRGDQIQRLFLEVTRLPVDKREAWLRKNCEDDQLLSEVRSLLQYDDLAHDPFESGLALAADMLAPRTQNSQPLPDVHGYEILREIGTGGQAVVYEAIQASTTQHVAMKMLRWGKEASAEERERLQREVLILARLSHRGIVSIIDSGKTDSGVFFIATEFVDGPTLDETYCASTDKSRIHGISAKVDRDTALQIFVKICKAVDAAHRAGVVHRDLKPSNILLDSQGEPRVLDFGLAKPGLRDWLDPVAQELTVSGQFMGSLPWASPEQAEGKKLDARSDIYSMGVILYQLVSGGAFPYDVSGSMSDVITQIIHGDPTPLHQLSSDAKDTQATPSADLADQHLNAIVMKALAKSPDDRYQSAREFSEAVGRYSVGSSHSETPKQFAERRSSQNLFIAVSVGLSIVACLAAFFNPLSKSDRADSGVAAAPHADTTAGQLEWKSFEEAWARHADDDSITKLADGWRVREREVAFPEVRSRVLLVRSVLRRFSDESFAMRLRSRDDTEVSVEIVRSRDGDADEIDLQMSGMGFLRGTSRCISEPGIAFEISVALLPDRVTLVHNGRVLIQLHAKLGVGPWTLVLDAKEADLDCLAFEYSQPIAVPAEFTADILPIESPVIDFIVAHGGAALSRPSPARPNDDTFQITNLTTDGSTRRDTVPAREVAKIARCRALKRLKLEQVTDPNEAVEHIAEMTSLTTIEFNYSQLNDDCFHHFAKLGQLQTLGLFGTAVENPDFAPLFQLTSLENLGIKSIEVGDAELDHLANIESLRTFAAVGKNVTGQGIKSLIRLKNLSTVELSSAQISGEGVRYFSQLPRLWSLNISGCDVCDEDIPNLSKMTNLGRLTIKNTRMTTEGIERLRQELPDCRIDAADGE